MRKARIWAILVIAVLLGVGLFLGRDMFAAIADAYEDRENMSVRVNDTNDPKILCSHAVETEKVAVRMEVVDVTKDIEGLNRRYRLGVECRNKSETQYRYRIELNEYSKSLISWDDAEVVSGSNYSFSDASGGMDVEFIPGEKQGNEGAAGTVGYRFYRNLPAPTIGTISVTVTTYLPYFDLQIHSFTQELTFPIIEP